MPIQREIGCGNQLSTYLMQPGQVIPLNRNAVSIQSNISGVLIPVTLNSIGTSTSNKAPKLTTRGAYCSKVVLARRKSRQTVKDKSFVCSYCPRNFSHKGHLKLHMVSHLDDGKEVVCEICQKKFAQKGHLILHSKSHKKSTAISSSVAALSVNQSSWTTSLQSSSIHRNDYFPLEHQEKSAELKYNPSKVTNANVTSKRLLLPKPTIPSVNTGPGFNSANQRIDVNSDAVTFSPKTHPSDWPRETQAVQDKKSRIELKIIRSSDLYSTMFATK